MHDVDVSLHRTSIHQILVRLGIDSLQSSLSRLRDDDRFRDISPESIILDAPKTSLATPFSALSASSDLVGGAGGKEGEGDVWFDWSFCEFWKMNFCEILLLVVRCKEADDDST